MKKYIKIGTDCSGIEAPIQALEYLGIPYKHIFSSEIDKFAIESILANYNPKTLYNDMTKERNLEDIDIYVCGFPCTPFSLTGKRLGIEDKRSNIFSHCVKVIKKKKPKIFILENVRSIMSANNGEYFRMVQEELNSLKLYEVSYVIMNTKDYGIPQNRERLFMIGLLKKNIIKSFEVPKYVKCKELSKYIDKSDTHKDEIPNFCKEYIKNQKGIFVNISYIKFTGPHWYQEYSPTLTTVNNMWNVKMHRKANIKELLALQGFPKNFKQVVSDAQLKKQIGNSMSVNVIVKILEECFDCVKI